MLSSTSLNPTIIPHFANDETKSQRNEFIKLETNGKLEENIYLAKLIFTIHKNKRIKNQDKSHLKKLQKIIHRKQPVIL